MRILIISDILFRDVESHKLEFEFDVKTWDSSSIENPGSNNEIIVDMSFSNNKPTERERPLLNELKDWFSKENYIGSNNFILVIICASEDKLFEFTREQYPGFSETSEDVLSEDFSAYDFLKGCVPNYSQNLIFRPSGFRHIIPLTPVREYLEEFPDSISYLYYCYLVAERKVGHQACHRPD